MFDSIDVNNFEKIIDISELTELEEEIDSEDVIGYDDLSETLSIDTNYDF